MRGRAIIGIVCAVVAISGLSFAVRRDIGQARAEIYRLELAASDIDYKIQNTSIDPGALNAIEIQLDLIRRQLSNIPSRHRLADWFSKISDDTAKASVEVLGVTYNVQKKRRSG
jgi:hypothetical protein